MKWLLIQAAGIHKDNEHLRECFSFKRAIEYYGWDCDVIGKRHNKPMYHSKYDVVILLEQYEPDEIPDIGKIDAQFKLQWIVDLHCQNKNFYLEVGKDCHMALHATKELIEPYSKLSTHQVHVWLPNAVDDVYFDGQGLQETKLMNLGFIGSKIPDREAFLDSVSKVIPMHRDFQIGQKMIDYISKMKMHMNYNISTDINYRTFETIGIGTCLNTNYHPQLKELGFMHGFNCLMYKDKSEAINNYFDYIGDNKWKSIAYYGYLLSKQHTYKERVKQIVKLIGGEDVFAE